MTKTGKALAALAACAVIAAALLSPNLGEARGGGGGGHGHASNYCTICARDSHGRIARSPETRQEFMTQTVRAPGSPQPGAVPLQICCARIIAAKDVSAHDDVSGTWVRRADNRLPPRGRRRMSRILQQSRVLGWVERRAKGIPFVQVLRDRSSPEDVTIDISTTAASWP
jgi:hypothetical protein